MPEETKPEGHEHQYAHKHAHEHRHGDLVHTLAWIRSLALPLAGFLALPARAADVPDNQQVSKLLSETKTMAFQLKEDAGFMESFTRTNVTWESQAVAINQIKDHVNALRKQEAKLQEAKWSASPWQKAAIARITPFVDELDPSDGPGRFCESLCHHLA